MDTEITLSKKETACIIHEDGSIRWAIASGNGDELVHDSVLALMELTIGLDEARISELAEAFKARTGAGVPLQ